MIFSIKRLGQIQQVPPAYLFWLRDLNTPFVSLLAGFQEASLSCSQIFLG
jgi:hypothetical protein